MSLQLGDFELDRERRQPLRSGQSVPLEPKAYELLSLLVERRPKALYRAQIRDVVWPGVLVSESTLGVAVNAIRQALGDDARQPRFIRTGHGFGYAFCGEVTGREAATRPRWPAVSAACTSNASALVNTQEWSRLVYTEEAFMGRTNIEIDDRLVARAMRLTGARTKREVVDIALRRVVEKGSLYRAVRRLRGRLAWSGDIDAWRSARTTGTNRS